MNIEKHIVEISLDSLEPEVNQFFQKLTGIDAANVPEKYGETVICTKNAIRDNLKLFIIYKCDNIKTIADEEVILENGMTYKGKMPVKILKDATQVITHVVTLKGFRELAESESDFLAQYLMDAWGSAYVESTQAWFGKKLLKELKEENKSRTHVWSPGQYGFEIQNQKTIFELLHPEEIGCTLTKTLMMVPVKSASGIVGIIDPDVKDLLLPCDFCPLGAKCPASKRGCAQL